MSARESVQKKSPRGFMSKVQRSMFNVRRSMFDVRPTSAFTLLEVLLAVAITGFVLAAASTMLVSVTNIWANRLESNFFEDHVDGVAEFVQSSFTKAGSEIANATSNPSPAADANTDGVTIDPNNPQTTPQISVRVNRGNNNTGNQSNNASTSSSLLRRSETPIAWAEPPGFAGYRDPLINFKFRDNPPLLVNTDNAPVMGIDAFLYFDRDEGLSLLWYSILQEEVENENDLRRTLISPYVKEMRYVYWDERFERWEEETEPQEGENDEYLLPRFIRLIFEKDEISMERTVSIPVPSQSALLF